MYTQMSPGTFEFLVSLISSYMTKKEFEFGKCIPTDERIVATLRFLATNDAQRSLRFSSWLRKTALLHIISETTYMT